ncbi:MAG TPA: DUF1003 domain-containing protein [Cyclobacteriaceae bacterium]|nr:DUF1003 domain-containing protein [Cyclobacteriaceae bacterium]
MEKKVNCMASGKEYPQEHAIPLSALDRNMQTFLTRRFPTAGNESYIGDDQLISLKKEYLNELLANEVGELDALEKEVINSISENSLLSEKIEDTIDEKLTVGDRVADRIAEFGGSWKFIIIFFAFILVWMGINIWWLSNRAFDPYPFILLNLILSCLAAIQAPVIMMSQNRQEAKDRMRSEHDYKINLKAELEIQLLHKKIDHLLIHQSKRLMEIQRIQTEMMEAVLKKLK